MNESLVKRLREHPSKYNRELLDEAADTIERLEKSAKTEANPIEMSEAEIMKALVVHFDEDKPCAECPYVDIDEPCHILLKKNVESVIDLINRKNAVIEEKSKKLREVLPIVAEIRAVVRAEAIKEFAEKASLYTLQFAFDFVRQFIKEKTKLDPVFSFNPTEEESNEYFAEVRSIFDQIAKEMGVK